MMQSKKKQVLNSDKNKEIKYPEGDKLFGVWNYSHMLEYSTIAKEILHDFGKIQLPKNYENYNTSRNISAVAKTLDNKSYYQCSFLTIKEVDLSTRKQIFKFSGKTMECGIITHDNRYLITASKRM